LDQFLKAENGPEKKLKESALTPEQQKMREETRANRIEKEFLFNQRRVAEERARKEGRQTGQTVARTSRKSSTQKQDQPVSTEQKRQTLATGSPTAGQRIPMLTGDPTEIYGEGIEPVSGYYAIVDLKNLQPSHLIDKDERISENPNFKHKTDQPRDYSPGSENHAKVMRHFNERKHRYWTTDNPDAIAGPSTIDENGQVSNGNGRVIAATLAAKKGDYDWMREAVKKAARKYNIPPEEVDKIEHPYLVRVHPGLNAGSKEFGLFARVGNEQTSQTEHPIREAASLGDRVLDMQELSDLSDKLSGDNTLGQVLSKQNHPLVSRLREALKNKAAYNKYFTGEKLHDNGKNLVEDMVLTRFIPAEVLEIPSETRSLKNALGTAVPQLIQAGDTIKKPLEKAFKFIANHPEVKSIEQLRDHNVRQGSLFEKGNEVDQVTQALLEEMYRTKGKGGQFSGPALRNLFHEIAKAASDRRRDTGGGSLFGEPETSWLEDALTAVNRAAKQTDKENELRQEVAQKKKASSSLLFSTRYHNLQHDLYSALHQQYYGQKMVRTGGNYKIVRSNA